MSIFIKLCSGAMPTPTPTDQPTTPTDLFHEVRPTVLRKCCVNFQVDIRIPSSLYYGQTNGFKFQSGLLLQNSNLVGICI
jgi:hypothetical protein